ncbi:MAG: phage head morphogenesis protein [Treponema sp.]|nr:phage head morphogenesis protein [Treponema sp.]
MERSRLAELDSLAIAAQKRISARIADMLSNYFNSLSTVETQPSKARLENPYLPDIDPDFVRETQTLITTALLLGMDHASRKLGAADEEIPPLPFEEAVSFMKSRIPMTKAEWNALEPKLRFRAFTVARLTQLDYIELARGRLVSALGKGEGYASTWNDIKAVVAEDGALNFMPGYWENVYRTNTQIAYTTGKLMQFQNNPPPAWRLLIVDDDRTSDICRGLMRDGKQSLTMASNHSFWETFGFPPYHYQCRTGLQAVYSSEIEHGTTVENPSMKSLKKQFKPMGGFGGNPLDKESWWMMTENMALRTARYGIFNDVEKFAKENGLYNFALNLVKGVDVEMLSGTDYMARKAAMANPLQKEVYAAKVLEEYGHTVYFTPENKKTLNYDAIINGRLGEFKRAESYKKIIRRLNEADAQRATTVCLETPAEGHTLDETIKKVRAWFTSGQKPINYVDTVLLIWEGAVIPIKK